MSDFEFLSNIIFYGLMKLALLMWLTVIFGALAYWPDLDGELPI